MIHMSVEKIIGNSTYNFTFIGEDLFDVVMESQQLGFRDVYKCGKCESNLLYLRAYKTEKDEFEYVKVCCASCKAAITFGKAKKDGAFFLRKTEDGKMAWETYEPKENSKSD